MSSTTQQIIPLAAVSNQTLSVVLNSQSCTINVYEKTLAPLQQLLVTDTGLLIVTDKGLALDVTQDVFSAASGLFLDLYVNSAPIAVGVLCLDNVAIVRDAYLGFTGDLAFVDTAGTNTDPVVSGLGTQYQLVYFP